MSYYTPLIVYNVGKKVKENKMGISEYGQIKLQIEELLQEKHISKNRICKELDIPRTNLNRYCNNKFQNIDHPPISIYNVFAKFTEE